MSSGDERLRGVEQDLAKLGRLAVHQLRRALDSFRTADLAHAEAIIEKDDVADNLNLAIEDVCFNLVAESTMGGDEARFLRSAPKVAANIERIGDAACHIAKHVRIIHIEGITPSHFPMAGLESIALPAVDEAVSAYLKRDLQLAELACSREPQLDAAYVDALQRLTETLRLHPDDATYLMHVYSVLKYLEKVGDYVLNIGEQALFLISGRRMKFDQYQQLDRLTGQTPIGSLQFHPYWDGISGALVARLETAEGAFVYKEGSQRKIAPEVSKAEEWDRILSGATPRIIRTATLRDREALLREFVQGQLLSDVLLRDEPLERKRAAVGELVDMVSAVWSGSLSAESPRVDYVRQIRDRLDEVYALHPELQDEADGGHGIALHDLLGQAERVEAGLAPSFSVWLHGDLNLNNVVIDSQTGRLKLIDIHRSHSGDYLEDLAVLLVSFERLAVEGERTRRLLRRLAHHVVLFGRGFARIHSDTTYPQRLRLALARSLITSARVVPDDAHARDLYSRGIGLLDRVRKEPAAS
ncbi:MAG TPA: PhoU domain-containing protein [Dehalococcoidia bacterium]|nr:PhoU domain-containing protein [Dehalococcoidia bacterium]